MKKLLFLGSIFLVTGCSMGPEPNTFEKSDTVSALFSNKDAADALWVVSRRDYPVYPVTAAQKGISGCVDFSFTINKNGKAESIQVIKAVPGKTFIRAATRSLKRFKWQATENNTSLQPASTTLQLSFSTTKEMEVAECI